MAYQRIVFPLIKTWFSKSLEFPAPSGLAFLFVEEPSMNFQTAHPDVLNRRQRPDILTVLHDLIEHDALV